tara:strand:+ start:17145 stop:18200 length:1056 start_codon:yes stop_codon:yes gene_type:complete
LHVINTIIQFIIRVDSQKKIIFFIENLSHFRFVEPLFNYFLNNKFHLTLLCFENPIDVNNLQHVNLKIIEIKDDIQKIKSLKNLEGDLFFTTTPSIGSSIFPKSKIYPKKNRPKYIYLFHSLVSPNEMYVKNSFKNFDIIFSPSDIISKQLRFLVSRHTTIFTTGYLIFNNVEKFTFKENNKKILLAPTWGKQGLSEIIEKINLIYDFVSKTGNKMIFRPHPMTKLKDYKIDSKIDLDLGLDLNNLHEYDHLITDFSGIALEFAYLTKRSILFLDVNKKIKRKISKVEKNEILIEDEMRTSIGSIVNIDELAITKQFPKINENKYENFTKKINSYEQSLKKTIEFLEKIDL